MNPTHKALRDGTAAAHARVDAAFAGFDLTDRDDYARFLSAHAEIVLPLEAALPGERIVADWDGRKRGHLLREDLAQLPRHPRAGGDPGSQAPSCVTLDPRLRGDDEGVWQDAEVAGILYVLEGSRLGGRFLSRGLPTGFPRAYLDADQAPENWRKLLAKLDAILYEPADLQSALAAAHRVFAAFERSAQRWAKGF